MILRFCSFVGLLCLTAGLAGQPAAAQTVTTSSHSPLVSAIQENDPDSIRSAASQGAAVNQRYDLTVHPSSSSDGIEWPPEEFEAATPLMHAVLTGHTRSVRALLDVGADPSAVSSRGFTALLLAASTGYEIMVHALLRADANPDQRTSHSLTPLIVAARDGHVETVRLLLEAGADPNLQTPTEGPPLTQALDWREEQAARVLLEAGADVNVRGRDQTTPLILAVKNGMVDLVDRLLDRGADVSLRDSVYGRTALMHLARSGVSRQARNVRESDKTRLLRMLLDAGSEVDARDASGQTPLILAVRGEQSAFVDPLLDAGSDPTAQDDEGWTALEYAVAQCNASLRERLLDASGAERDPLRVAVAPDDPAEVEGGRRALAERAVYPEQMYQYGEPVTITVTATVDTDGRARRPHIQSCRGNVFSKAALAVVKDLPFRPARSGGEAVPMRIALPIHFVPPDSVRARVEADTTRRRRQTPPSTLRAAIDEHDLRTAQRLLEQGASPTARIDTSLDVAFHRRTVSVQDLSLLAWASYEGDFGIVRALLDAGASPNEETADGWTPLIFAARQDHPWVLRLLVARGARLSVPDDGSSSVLHWTAAHGNDHATRALLEAGASPSVWSAPGYTPLLIAATYGHPTIARLLLEAGADPQAPVADAASILHEAITQDAFDVAAVLARRGANVNLRSSDEEVPLYRAVSKKNAGLVSVLIEHNAALDVQKKNGATPLAHAATLYEPWVEGLRLLVEAGADLDVMGENGRTALMNAAMEGHPDVVRLLLQNGADPTLRDDDGRQAIDLVRAAISDLASYESDETRAALEETKALLDDAN